jgi:FkbM family methyltransferase
MGKVDTYDLFGPNELILFAFYDKAKYRYDKVLDIGANVGLHSLLMAQLGWHVKSFEPDPEVFKHLRDNLYYEHEDVELNEVAVSDFNGEVEFVRVLNNLTGSHIEGFKESYGPRETVKVKCVDCRPLFDWADLAKIDVEGHESKLLLTLTEDNLKHLDLICELRGFQEAARVLQHVHSIGGHVYTQKNDWEPARCMSHMPTKHQEGSIFISGRGGPWR